MTLLIELPPDVEARLLADAEAQGKDAAKVAAERVADYYTSDRAEQDHEAESDRAWWNSLSESDRQAEFAALQRAFDDADAGRVRDAAQVFADLRALQQGASAAVAAKL
jgi:predicted transcriptional regulator